MKKRLFGTLEDGTDVYLYTIENENASLSILDRGATIQNFTVFGKSIIGGFDTLESYLKETSHQGATIGRVANRIKGAHFEMDGKVYNLPKNNGNNCLHGGIGFDYKMWCVTDISDEKVTLEYTSADGEEGFPAELKVAVSFTLLDTDLIIDYKALPGGKTPIALTNHSYFNLDGFGATILKHKAKIYANSYTEVDKELIPIKNTSVRGTAFDFTDQHEIGERIGGSFIGYDHNFNLNPTVFESFSGKKLGLCAEVFGKDLSLSVYTDQPGVQFYIGNFLGDGEAFSGNIPQVRHGAFCLETQTEPDLVNKGSIFYTQGELYTHTTVYRVGLISK